LPLRLRWYGASVPETYEITSGSRALTRRDATTPQHALMDYLRSLGCSDAEIVRIAPDQVSWRGARYSAAPLPGSGSGTNAPAKDERG
jgi:hypothetical protein